MPNTIPKAEYEVKLVRLKSWREFNVLPLMTSCIAASFDLSFGFSLNLSLGLSTVRSPKRTSFERNGALRKHSIDLLHLERSLGHRPIVCYPKSALSLSMGIGLLNKNEKKFKRSPNSNPLEQVDGR